MVPTDGACRARTGTAFEDRMENYGDACSSTCHDLVGGLEVGRRVVRREGIGWRLALGGGRNWGRH
jgi:hypothetical protein